jgi:hypothetical protein
MHAPLPDIIPFDVTLDAKGRVRFRCRACKKRELQSKSGNATNIWWLEYLHAFGQKHGECK